MSPDNSGTQIGATLRDARRRYGMEVREVEERTKIRARYIRALENEDWQALPAPAYVRGFLRTYGQLLGLDGEMLADEFRRRYGDDTSPAGSGPSEPLLSESRRTPGDRLPSRLPLIAAVLGGIVVLLLLLSLLGGDEDDGEQQPRQNQGGQSQQAKQQAQKQKRREAQAAKERKQKQQNQLRPEQAKLTARTDVQVCLVGGGKEALIDNQVLGTGTEETYSGSKRYRLTIAAGRVKFVVGDNESQLEVGQAASFEADSQGIREIEYRGPDCP